ncbi:XRE family transcriptional regulator [Lactococcus lactis subsp. lactis]|uniref:helix-turn-helix domain-containing protein n=1 Tax=Lactococcus lactis TaxID=1358 RepID=UPI00223BBF48|nr:helix-turn-helix transcriptional regulator [Lactococcus lactis]MCT0016596.1 XRE family transcriptional regulator [Lactococcus lactis subsp. lactis]
MIEKTVFYKRLKEQAKLSQKSFNQIERDLGYSRNALHNYKVGRQPSGVRLIELANYFQIDPEYLIGMKNITTEKAVEGIFIQLTSSQRKEMLILCEKWFFGQISLSK